MKNNMQTIFSTEVWGFILNDQHYQSLDYVDTILDMKKNVASVKKSNFGGWQSDDLIHENYGIFREFTSSSNTIANNILADYNCKPVRVKEMWANVNGHANFNGAHTHSGILSGVFYLHVPANSGRLIFVNPAVRSDGHLLRKSNYAVNPERLACIMFPSWLEHYVEPNLSDEERISISFNIGVA